MKEGLREVLVRDEMESRVNQLFPHKRDKEAKISDMFCNSHVCSFKTIK